MIELISVGFDLNVGVLILRLPEGLDYSGILADVDDPVFNGGRGLLHSSSTGKTFNCKNFFFLRNITLYIESNQRPCLSLVRQPQ